jgi:hypothetical protein
MAIIRKERLQPALAELDAYYQKLRKTVEGVSPHANACLDYNCEADQFQREYTDVDIHALTQAIGHFKVAVDGLKTVKALAKHR